MVSSPGLLLLAPRQADSEPQLPRASSSRQLAGALSARPATELGCSGCRATGAAAAATAELPEAALVSAPAAAPLGSGDSAATAATALLSPRTAGTSSDLSSCPFQDCRAGSASGSQQLFPAPDERFRCHPVGTAVLILLLLVLVLALGVALAVLAAPQVPVTSATPQCCPHDWIGYNGVCYYFSRDYGTWDQGQERCSELNASLAIAKDEEAMDFLCRLCGNVDYWLGLRRRGERLHWGDGSSYSSR
ncbi:uncharacterized protein LOC141729982 [Zonotrichia albicollis]|uniref:uncharacterized protein LOC141729982 n=1 Tax=Zonotrichia albicollis TaxID=44394 RepID=UPI003D810164